MRVMTPYAGDNVADVCRRAYFEVMKGNEPIVIHFNEVSIMFTNDENGYRRTKSKSFDNVDLEWISGMTIKELYDSSTQSKIKEIE